MIGEDDLVKIGELLESKLDKKLAPFLNRLTVVENSVTEIVNIAEPTFKRCLQTIIKEEVNESKEQEKRVKNIVITGLEEAGVSRVSDGDDDVVSLPVTDNDDKLEMFMSQLHVENGTKYDVVQKFKLKGESSISKWVVKFDDVRVKYEILAGAKTLSKNPQWGSVFITPDLTKRQQTESYLLRQDLKKKRADSGADLVIFKGHVVPREIANRGRK